MKRKISIFSILSTALLLAAIAITTTVSIREKSSSTSSLTLSNIKALTASPEAGTPKYDNYVTTPLDCWVNTQILINVSMDPNYEVGAYFDYSISLVEKLMKANVTFTVIPAGYYGTIIDCPPGIGDCTPYSCGI